VSGIETHLDGLSFRGAHLRLVASAGLGIFLDGYDSAMMAIALIFIAPLWHLTGASLGLIAASTLLGAMAGGAIGGRCADLYGRKWLYLVDIATFFVAALLSAISWNPASLMLFRFLVGIGIGVDYPLSATFLAEFAPRARRGSMMSWAFGLFAVGGLLALVVGYLLSLLGTDSWRLLFASGAVPALGLLLLRRTLPESPRWLLRRQRPAEAAAALRRFNPDWRAGTDEPSADARVEATRASPQAWRQLFSRQYIRRTILVSLPWFMMDMVDYGFAIYVPTLLLAFGMKTFGGTLLFSILLACIGLPAFILVASLIDRIGRIRSQSMGFLGMAAAMAALAVLAMSAKPPILLIALFMVFVKVSNAFTDITTWVLPVELFPTDLRASAHGFATSFSRIGAAASVFLFPILREYWGVGLTLLLIAGAQIIASLTTVLMACEPAKRGLEEIAPPPVRPLMAQPACGIAGADQP
jgi:putative MFS transporter